MHLLASIVFFCFARCATPDNVTNTTLGQMTLSTLCSSAISAGCYIFAIKFFIQSLESDRIWPWHWTLPYLGNLCIRLAVISGILFVAYKYYSKDPLGELLILAFSGIFILAALFSSDLDFFEEKNDVHGKSTNTLFRGYPKHR